MVWKVKNPLPASQTPVQQPQTPIEQYNPVQPTPAAIKQAVEGTQVKASEPNWIVDEVPTQTTLVIRNVRTGQTLDIYSAMAEILNRTEQ